MAADPAPRNGPPAAVAFFPTDPAPRPPWGPWASLAWTALAAFIMLASLIMTLIGSAYLRLLANPKVGPSALVFDGKLAAIATLIGAPLVVGLVAILSRSRGWRVGDYLALRPASLRATILATAGLIIGLAASTALTIALGRPIVPPLSIALIAVTPLWLASLAAIVAAPIASEVACRGFLYRGFVASPRLGPGMAIGITALAWAASQVVQYDFEHDLRYNLYSFALIYFMGLYLGLVRHLSGSTILTIVLHVLANLIAMVEAVRLGS